MAFSDEVNITISFTAYTRQAEVLILYLVLTGKQKNIWKRICTQSCT